MGGLLFLYRLIMVIFVLIFMPCAIGYIIRWNLKGSDRSSYILQTFIETIFEDCRKFSTYWMFGFLTIAIIIVIGLLVLFFWNLFMNNFGFID